MGDMMKTKHFWGLSIFIVAAIVFYLPQAAFSGDPVFPGSQVVPRTIQQPVQQKPAIKILNTDTYKLLLTTEYLQHIKSDLYSLESSIYSLKGEISHFQDSLKTCTSKSYTYEEQIAAGCLPNDTIQQCSDKLLKSCAGPDALDVKGKSDSLQNKLIEQADKLKVLSNLLQQKFQ
jgi:hypothetical protein